MLRMLTIAYITQRRNCRFEWFASSLKKQEAAYGQSYNLVVVDFHFDEERFGIFSRLIRGTLIQDFKHVPPKPSVWQGSHRLTQDNWFSAANARNTALCLAPDGWIVYVDDLSVLCPGWFDAVRSATVSSHITLGAYKKVKNLTVDSGGNLTGFNEFPGGVDNRLRHTEHAKCNPVPCGGEWLFGSSLAVPVEALLSINGWPEDLCDGLGFEDVPTGIVLANAGFQFCYNRAMLTLESEEMHQLEPRFRYEDPGQSPCDKSHKVLEIARASKHFENTFGIEGGIRELRAHALPGGTFPVRTTPVIEWFTGKPLANL